jgi:hypothetical protein
MNQFVISAVAEKIASQMTERYIGIRAQKGNRAAFEEVLAKAPAIEPDEEDSL